MIHPGASRSLADPALVAPPRHVPLMLRLRVWLGGALAPVAWLLLAASALMLWPTVGGDWLRRVVYLHGELGETSARVVGVEDTGLRIGGSGNRRSTRREYRIYHYEYRVGDHRYVASDRGHRVSYGVDQHVRIQYAPANPRRSRIPDLHSFLLLPFVFLAIGIVLIGVDVPRARRADALLRRGRRAEATLVASAPTSVVIMGRKLVRCTIEFDAADGRRQRAQVRTTQPPAPGSFAAVLYDPAAPQNLVLADSLRGSPRIDARGDLEGGLARLLPYLAAPLIAVAAHAVMIERALR